MRFGRGPGSWWGRHRHDIDNFLVTYPRLMWLRKWLQVIFDNEENLQNQVTALGDAVIEGIDTPSVDLTIVDDPLKETIEFDPISEEEKITYEKKNPTVQADVKISSDTKLITVGTPPNKPYKFLAENAIEIMTDEDKSKEGLFSPDLLPLVQEIYDEVEGTTDSSLTGAAFNTITSFGISFTDLNYHSFFEKETGVYFAYSAALSNSTLSPTFTGNVLGVFDKVGNLMAFLSLDPLPGQVIGNIINLFVSYSKKTGDYYIEIGCDNESAYAFIANKNLVFSKILNIDKNVHVTEFNSFQSFGTIIGSENTAIPIDGDPTPTWYSQTVTIWNTKSNKFLYGPRANFYNGAALTEFSPQEGIEFDATTSMSGASADYYGNITVVYSTSDGQVLSFMSSSTADNTLELIVSRQIKMPTTAGAGSTLLSYTKKFGTLETIDSSETSPEIYGIQILNQSKDVSDSDREWTILLNHSKPGINDSNSSFVSGFGNSSSAIIHQLMNSESIGIDGLFQLQEQNSFASQLSGISMKGEYNLSKDNPYGIDISTLNDMPDKQQGLVIPGYSDATKFNFKNNKVAINRFIQELSWDKTALDPSPGIFDNTVTVRVIRRVILAIPYQGSPNSGQIGEWSVGDLNLINSRELSVEDTNSINLTKTGSWSGGDPVENLKGDVNLSSGTESVTLNNGDVYSISNGTKIKTDGVWSGNYLEIINDINDKLEALFPDGYFTVIKKYRVTVPLESFENTSPSGSDNQIWFSGAVGSENYFTVPKADMDILDGFMTQNEVSSTLIWATTTAVQTVQDLGDNYRINIDTYGMVSTTFSPQQPQSVVVNLLAYGRKKFQSQNTLESEGEVDD